VYRVRDATAPPTSPFDGKYKRRPEAKERNAGTVRMIAAGHSWNDMQAATGCSRATIAKLAKRLEPA
jgi:DNA invertase Pin-like site-specific DNA recombinase